jgi:hypothetical protein
MCFGDADAQLDSISLIADLDADAEASSRRPPVLRCDSMRDSSSRHMMTTAEEWKVKFWFCCLERVYAPCDMLHVVLLRVMQHEYYTLPGFGSIMSLWSA